MVAVTLFVASCSGSSKSGNSDDAAQQETNRPAEFASDDELLDYIQKVHFNYMWEGAEATSGLACERIHLDGDYPQNDKDVVTTGGSGFGIAGVLAAIDRGFVSREEGVKRQIGRAHV